MTLPKHQRGLSFIGWLFVIAIFVFFLMIGLKSFPIYMNHFKLASIMKWAASQPSSGDSSPIEIRNMIQRKFDIDNVDYVTPKDIKVVGGESGQRSLSVDYEVRINMFYNIDVVYKFSEEFLMSRGGLDQ